MTEESVSRVYELLRRLPSDGLQAAKQLFWTELNYDRASTPLSDREWPEHVRKVLAEPPTLFARAESEMGTFSIVYCRLAADQVGRAQPLSLAAERQVIGQLLPNHPYTLFLFSDPLERHWHLVNVRADKDAARRRILRRIAVGPYERLRTAAERITMLDVGSLSAGLFGTSPLAIQQLHDRAFDVEAVTEQFFREYCTVFAALQGDLEVRTKDQRWAHDYTLQLLNRLMFLYFIQRKLWLGNDPDFLSNFWRQYRHGKRPEDTFATEWLNPLFFEAFSNRFQGGRADRQHLPPEVREALAMAPYLNGGLFEPSDLDRKYEVAISDTRFELVFRFLEKYNFTISEDTPLDQEVAVDPEMIGKVYESLVNVSEEADERGDAGIFYTPRVEIDLMCRLALVSWLINQLGDQHRSLMYQLVFAFEPEDKRQADAAVAALDLWPRLNDLLRSVTVVDPACGSGSFLVGMLYVLDDLLARAAAQLGIEETAYERKKRIVGSSLYGVDVMGWAVHVAELRLWLQLVVDTPFSNPAELKFRPLLPNLSFKVRTGDSLVQEIGGINLALRKGSKTIPAHLKGQITQLKGEKLKFYGSDPTRKYQTAQQLQAAELGLYRDIVSARLQAVEARLKEVEDGLAPRVNLFGELDSPQLSLNRLELERDRDRLQLEQSQLIQARQALRTAKDIPFVWDIAFVEVFEGDRGGFDIVMGNPPYVRHELIRDPRLSVEAADAESKRRYRVKLARSVYAAWPQTFAYDWGKDEAKWKLDAKSDLYVYFYLYGLSLLNDNGVFCFITSNSWLDVGYGKDLQQFLLTQGQVYLVLDNQTQRSFASADVNTVIAMLGSAQDSRRSRAESLTHLARFVMCKVPFEQVLHAEVWSDVQAATGAVSQPDYRVVVMRQETMLEAGTDPSDNQYAGGKWGGTYLRAPEILPLALEKGKDRLAKLGAVIRLETYLNTGGADPFFIVRPIARRSQVVTIKTETGEQFDIEADWVRPFVKSPSELRSILIKQTDAAWAIVIPPENAAGYPLLSRYIKWGEDQGYHLRSGCLHRTPWWKLPPQASKPGKVIWSRLHHDRHLVGYNPECIPYTNFYALHWSDPKIAAAILNTSFFVMIREVMGKANFGGGVLKTDGNDIRVFPCVDLRKLTTEDTARVNATFTPILKREIGRVAEEVKLSDRRALDDVVFDMLNLTQSERDDFYEELLGLIDRRIKKSRSLQQREEPQ